ncbi:MAG TPA: hypothetical protein VNZ52_08190 [Candidatus Thermoplasmatota archaeon]|nr:hypothetical protein [Candidatus Thermoplasmatota archaeon]
MQDPVPLAVQPQEPVATPGPVSVPVTVSRKPTPLLDWAAHRLSDALAPLFVQAATWAFLSFYFLDNAALAAANSLLGFVFMVAVPLAIPYYYMVKGIDTIHVSKRENRALPLAVAFSGYVLFWAVEAFVLDLDLFAHLIAAALWVGILVGLITLRFKISIHMSGNAVALTQLALLFPPATLFLLLHGPVAWARLHLKAHTPAEILAGVTLGTLGPVLYFWLFPVF